MRVVLVAFLLLLQDPDAELQGRLTSIVARAGDLDAAVRAEAAEDAVRLSRDREEALAGLVRQKKALAITVLALAGKFDAATLFKIGDRSARSVACDLIVPTK